MTLSVFMTMVRHEKHDFCALPLPFTCTHAHSSDDDDVVAKINRNIGIIVRNKITNDCYILINAYSHSHRLCLLCTVDDAFFLLPFFSSSLVEKYIIFIFITSGHIFEVKYFEYITKASMLTLINFSFRLEISLHFHEIHVNLLLNEWNEQFEVVGRKIFIKHSHVCLVLCVLNGHYRHSASEFISICFYFFSFSSFHYPFDSIFL